MFCSREAPILGPLSEDALATHVDGALLLHANLDASATQHEFPGLVQVTEHHWRSSLPRYIIRGLGRDRPPAPIFFRAVPERSAYGSHGMAPTEDMCMLLDGGHVPNDLCCVHPSRVATCSQPALQRDHWLPKTYSMNQMGESCRPLLQTAK